MFAIHPACEWSNFRANALDRTPNDLYAVFDGVAAAIDRVDPGNVVSRTARILYGPNAFALAINRQWTPDHLGGFTLWDSTGGVHLLTIECACVSHEVLRQLEAAMNLWTEGRVACADCGTVVPVTETRAFYAGRYCPACWSGKQGRYAGCGGWSTVAARENYD